MGFSICLSLLLLSCDDLLPTLLNGSPEFNRILHPCLSIRHVVDKSISWDCLNSGLYAGVKTRFSEEQRDATQSMKAVIVGEFG